MASINRLVEENPNPSTVNQNQNQNIPDVASLGVPDPRPGLNANPTPAFYMPRSAWVSSPQTIVDAQPVPQQSILPPHPNLVGQGLPPTDTLQPDPVLHPPPDYARRHIPPSPPAPYCLRLPTPVPSNPTQYGHQHTVAPQASTLQSFSQPVEPQTSTLPANARPIVAGGGTVQSAFVRLLASSSVPRMRRMDQQQSDYRQHGFYQSPPQSFLQHSFNQQPLQSSAQPSFQQFTAAPPRTTQPNLNQPAVVPPSFTQPGPLEFVHDPRNPTRRRHFRSKSAEADWLTVSEYATQHPESFRVPPVEKKEYFVQPNISNLLNDDPALGAKRKREGQFFSSKLVLSRPSPEPFVTDSPTQCVPPGPLSPPPSGPLPNLPPQVKEKSRKPKGPLSKASFSKASSSKPFSTKKARSPKSDPSLNTPSGLAPIQEQPSPELQRQPTQEALVSPLTSPPPPTNGLIRQSPRKRPCVSQPINLSTRDFELIQPRFVRKFLGNFLSLDHPVHTLQFTTSRQAQFKSLIVALAEALAAITDLQTDLTNPKVQISAIPRLFEAFGSQRIPSDTNCLPFIFGHSIISLLIADGICTHVDGLSASSPRITKQHSTVTHSKRKAGLSSHASSQDNVQHTFPPDDLEDDFIAGTLVLTARLQRSLSRSPLTGDPSLAEPPSYKTFAMATPKNAVPKGLYLYSSDVPTKLLEEFEVPSKPCAKYPLDVSYVRLPLEFANITLWILENKVFNPPPSMI